MGGSTGPSKQEQFRILKDGGFTVPPHGTVDEVLGSWWDAEQQWVKWVVAYTDPMAHCTEGKEVWWKQCQALNIQPRMGYDAQNERAHKNYESFCSAFVGCFFQVGFPEKPAVSIRRLQIGRHVFWIQYESTESWMSNYGEGKAFTCGIELDNGYHPTIRLPLFAIDFVWGKNDLYAVDFNTAPGIRGSGVENHLSGPNAVASLEQALEDLCLTNTATALPQPLPCPTIASSAK